MNTQHIVDPSEASAAVTDAVLRTEDLAVHFGGIKAVDGISISLARGQIAGILGPNGSGKSTLLGAVTRLTRTTRGAMFFEGTEYSKVRPEKVARLGIGRTFQTVRLLDDLTVYENVQLGYDLVSRRRIWQRGSAQRVAERDAVETALARSGLTAHRELRPDELSYGLQRRVEIARAIVMSPKLLILDEPAAGMNKFEREEISRLLIDLRAEGLTQLIVEHDVQMMVETCDHLFAMNSGRLIAEGTPQDVVQHSAVREAYLGKRDDDA